MINLVRRVRINDRIPAMWYNDKLIRTAYRKETLIVGEYEYDPNPSPYATKYFCIESLENGNTIYFIKGDYAPNNTYYVSFDETGTWTEYYGTQHWTVNAGHKIYFKATTNSWSTEPENDNYVRWWYFESTKTFDVSGNIMSLIYGDDFAGKTTLKSNKQFYSLFSAKSPNQSSYCKVVHADKLILPAAICTTSCYQRMFNQCYSLLTAPDIQATVMGEYCCGSMFYSCSSLVTPPELKSTALAEDCYYQMFGGCSSLTTAPELKATILANGCYGQMFIYCTSLVKAPELPAPTLARACYYSMFYGCTNLNYIKCLATDWSSYNCLMTWVQGVAASGTFIKDASVTWPTATSPSYAGVPSGWTVQDAA